MAPIIKCSSAAIPSCVLDSTLFTLSIITLIAILVHTARKLLIERNLWLKGQIIVLLVAILQFSLMSLKYAFFTTTALTLLAVGFKYAQLTLLCYFFVDQALSIMMHDKSRRHIFLVPSLFVLLFFLSCILLVTIAVNGVDQINCVHIGWFLLSVSGFVMSLIFVAAGAIITRRIRSTTTMSESIWRVFKQSMWIVIIVYTLSCTFGVAYDVFLLVIRFFSEDIADRTCENVFFQGEGVMPYINVAITVCQRVVNLFIPIYAVIIGLEIQLRRTRRSRRARHSVKLPTTFEESSSLFATTDTSSDTQSDRESGPSYQ